MTGANGSYGAQYETCRYDGNPYPCDVHVGCYAAGFDRCQDVRTTVTEDEQGRTSETRCHACGNGFGVMYEPREWYAPTVCMVQDCDHPQREVEDRCECHSWNLTMEQLQGTTACHRAGLLPVDRDRPGASS